MNDIFDFINAFRNGTFGSVLVADTEPTMRKTNNPYVGRVRKVCRLSNIAIGYSYETYVNARRLRENLSADFKACPLQWGEWKKNYENVVLTHKGEDYLRVTMLPNTNVEVTYMVDGRVATESEINEIKSFLSKSSSSRQGLTNEVIVRAYKVSNIVSLTQGEKRYEKPFAYATES